jgi:transposase
MIQQSMVAANHKISLSEEEVDLLEKIIRKQTNPQHLVLRANIILTASKGLNISQSARHLRVTVNTIKLWRNRWNERLDWPIANRFADAPRSGAPPTFSPEQLCAIIALSCEKPEKHGRPITHWTQRELADEAIKQGIVESISPRSVGRFLKSGRDKAAQNSLLADA